MDVVEVIGQLMDKVSGGSWQVTHAGNLHSVPTSRELDCSELPKDEVVLLFRDEMENRRNIQCIVPIKHSTAPQMQYRY